MLTSSSKLWRPGIGHQRPKTRNAFTVVRSVGKYHIIAFKVLDHTINKSINGSLITTRTPVFVIHTGELTDPDWLAEFADVVFDHFDALGDSGFVDMYTSDVPSNALRSEVGKPGLIQLCTHGRRAKCNTTVTQRFNQFIPFLHTNIDVCDV